VQLNPESSLNSEDQEKLLADLKDKIQDDDAISLEEFEDYKPL
jgi:hypothetical protein